jgi:hypothetical protein
MRSDLLFPVAALLTFRLRGIRRVRHSFHQHSPRYWNRSRLAASQPPRPDLAHKCLGFVHAYVLIGNDRSKIVRDRAN